MTAKVFLAVLFLSCNLTSQAQDIFVPRELKAQPAHQVRLESRGLVPYHRLTLADFAINDKFKPRWMMVSVEFCLPQYGHVVENRDGCVVARVSEWAILSGLDRPNSSRKSWFTDFKNGLIHEQGHHDINELHARELAAVSIDTLPVGEGYTPTEAIHNLDDAIETFVSQFMSKSNLEQMIYDRETSHESNGTLQKKWTAKLNKRLRLAGITYEVAKR